MDPVNLPDLIGRKNGAITFTIGTPMIQWTDDRLKFRPPPMVSGNRETDSTPEIPEALLMDGNN